jgi:D-alanyl-D-alanine carboxypeptidase/D-alanyl-D-alanine-endopeptidase (penicillin-binding protein 4)
MKCRNNFLLFPMAAGAKSVMSLFALLMFFTQPLASDGTSNGNGLLLSSAELRSLQTVSREILASPLLRHGRWSCTVMDVASGKVLLAIDSDKSLPPASNLKLITAYAALKLFGPEHRFRTLLGYSGTLGHGNLDGDLIVRGGGDPALGSDRFGPEYRWQAVLTRWVKKIRESGIRTISGNLIADLSLFDPLVYSGGWLWMDIGNYYGAGPSALNFHENFYTLVFRPGKKAGDPARVLRTEPWPLPFTFQNWMKTGPPGSGDQGYIYGALDHPLRVLHGTVPAGPKEFRIKGSLPNPARTFLELFRQQLEMAGVPVRGDIRIRHRPVTIGTVLDTLPSPPLKDLVFWMNKKSINLFADVLLKQIGVAQEGTGSFAGGIRALLDLLNGEGMDTGGMILYDGSGLSPLDRVTTKQLSVLLRIAAQQPFFETFYRSLPIAGVKDESGHLSRLCRGTEAAGNVRAKTGFINGVRAHSGYVRTANGRLLCFSMIASDFAGSVRQMDRLHEKMMVALARLQP